MVYYLFDVGISIMEKLIEEENGSKLKCLCAFALMLFLFLGYKRALLQFGMQRDGQDLQIMIRTGIGQATRHFASLSETIDREENIRLKIGRTISSIDIPIIVIIRNNLENREWLSRPNPNNEKEKQWSLVSWSPFWSASSHQRPIDMMGVQISPAAP